MMALPDEGGVLPVQAVGLSLQGAIPSGNLGLNYVFEYGSSDTIRIRLDGIAARMTRTMDWTTQAYRGEGTEPVAVFSNGMQKEAVLAIPGAIAIMDVRALKPGLKIMKIEGKLPGEEGYPLH